MTAKSRKRFPGASAYKDRHGRRRWRYQSRGFSAELGTEYASAEFCERYESALKREREKRGEGAAASRAKPRSIAALVASYYRSRDFKDLSDSTKTTYRSLIEPFAAEHGHRMVATLEPRHVAAIIAKKAETPSAANNLRKRIRQLMNHAIFLEWRPKKDNPVAVTKPLKVRSHGFHTWTEAEIARFNEVHKPGTLAYRAMTLMLYTGAARADAVKLGRGNISGRTLTYRRQKTNGDPIEIPIHAELAAVIAETDPSAFTFLQTRQGKSRSPDGLGNMMRKWCDAASLPDCASHGLRKAIAKRLAEAGATTVQIMAVTGHLSLSEAEIYVREANRKKAAKAAITKLSKHRNPSKG